MSLIDLLFSAWYLQIPVVIGGVLHMFAVTYNWLPALKKPIQQRLFGANKTWRGMLLVPLFTALGAACLWPAEQALGESALFADQLLLAGLVAGIGYVLAELPNSWIKRRLGIGAGELPTRYRYFVMAGDQLDSALGVAIAYGLLLNLSWPVLITYVLSFPFTALAVKRLLFIAKLKRSAV